MAKKGGKKGKTKEVPAAVPMSAEELNRALELEMQTLESELLKKSTAAET